MFALKHLPIALSCVLAAQANASMNIQPDPQIRMVMSLLVVTFKLWSKAKPLTLCMPFGHKH